MPTPHNNNYTHNDAEENQLLTHISE